jgi:hypothetical protein
LIRPRSLSGKACDLGFQLNDLSRKVIQGGEILADAELLDGGNGEGLPPGKVGEGEGIAVWGGEVVTKKEGLKAVGGHGAVMNEAAAVGEETAGIADNDGWNPHHRDEVGGEEPGERHGIDLVGLDPSGGDELDQTGVGNDDLGDERRAWSKKSQALEVDSTTRISEGRRLQSAHFGQRGSSIRRGERTVSSLGFTPPTTT